AGPARGHGPSCADRCLAGYSRGPAVRGATVAPALRDRFPPSDGSIAESLLARCAVDQDLTRRCVAVRSAASRACRLHGPRYGLPWFEWIHIRCPVLVRFDKGTRRREF